MKASFALPILIICILLTNSCATTPETDEDHLWRAVRSGDHAEVKRLIGTGVDVNAGGGEKWTVLMVAAANGHTEVARLLIEAGADVHAKTEVKDISRARRYGGWTPLLLAARNGHTETIKLLIETGADIDAQNNMGWTALMIAIMEGDNDTFRVLIEEGADVNAQDEFGRTALMIASMEGHTDIARLLIEGGADLDIRLSSVDDYTALMIACNWENRDIVKLLVEAGADVNIRTKLGLRGVNRKGRKILEEVLEETGTK